MVVQAFQCLLVFGVTLMRMALWWGHGQVGEARLFSYHLHTGCLYIKSDCLQWGTFVGGGGGVNCFKMGYVFLNEQ